MPSVQPTAPTPAFPLEQPDITISVRQTFGINSDLQVPAFSQASEHVPDLDDAYRFDRDTTLGSDPANPGKPKVSYTNTYFITFRETTTRDTLWTSPKLPGAGLDLVIDDPKNAGKQGLLVLFDGAGLK